jgi:hypothetical protein
VADDDFLDLLNSVSKKARESGFSTLDLRERIIYCVDWLQFEVAQGGLETFYSNSAGNNAVATVEALGVIGAHECAGALRALHALFPGGTPAEDQAVRGEQIDQLRSQQGSMIFRELEERLTPELDALPEMLEAYLNRAV